VTHIRNEIDLHIDECKQFGLSQAAMDQCEESEGKHPGAQDTLTSSDSFSLYGLLAVHP